MLAGVAVVGLAVAVALSQRAPTRTSDEIEHPVGEHLNLTDPTSPTPGLDVPRTFSFKMPRVIGVPLNQAKTALRAALGNAQSEDQSVSLQEAYDDRAVFRVTKRQTGSAEPGTVLQIGNRPAIPKSATFTISPDVQPGDVVRVVFRLVIATRPIQRPGQTSGGGGGGGTRNCTPGYSPCLVYHGGADYDCYGGTGDGPYYTMPGVTYTVTGPDPYDLDRGDGKGCE